MIHVCLFCVRLSEGEVYFVQGLRDDPPGVRAFESLRAGLDYFEGGFNRAIGRGGGFMAGACVSWMQLQPRILTATEDQLREMIGDPIRLESLSSAAVHEVVVRCGDQAAAAKAYEGALAPRLVPA